MPKSNGFKNVGYSIAANGSRLDAGRELEIQKLNISRMFNRITKAEFITNALLAFKPMLGDAFIRSILNVKNKQYEF